MEIAGLGYGPNCLILPAHMRAELRSWREKPSAWLREARKAASY